MGLEGLTTKCTAMVPRAMASDTHLNKWVTIFFPMGSRSRAKRACLQHKNGDENVNFSRLPMQVGSRIKRKAGGFWGYVLPISREPEHGAEQQPLVEPNLLNQMINHD